ncbi:hypothetical protein SG34_033110 [Thalassomonas viridans]|uniref:CHRD domain-containing protein n=1 Tax=Thalassomonas viridans TaxID=137584 RepID=A0AAF0CCX8_9GAMM|nr:hypothetical protein [Thalassomonas viridans]WDE08743.1 hypothetical protein SG34_033110 [Thalassomonas viridans]
MLKKALFSSLLLLPTLVSANTVTFESAEFESPGYRTKSADYFFRADAALETDFQPIATGTLDAASSSTATAEFDYNAGYHGYINPKEDHPGIHHFHNHFTINAGQVTLDCPSSFTTLNVALIQVVDSSGNVISSGHCDNSDPSLGHHELSLDLPQDANVKVISYTPDADPYASI